MECQCITTCSALTPFVSTKYRTSGMLSLVISFSRSFEVVPECSVTLQERTRGERQRDRGTERQRDRGTETKRAQRDREIERDRDRDRETETDGETGRQGDRMNFLVSNPRFDVTMEFQHSYFNFEFITFIG